MSTRRACAAAVCALALALPSAAGATRPIPGQYIVVLQDGLDAPSVASEHLDGFGVRALYTYSAAVDGYTARLSQTQLRLVKADPRVAFVTQDVEGNSLMAQTLPTGIDRFDADASTTLAGDGSGETAGDVAVYDTGIQTTHPDLNVTGGVNCLGAISASNDGTINDGHGHGTHLAGIIGARDDANGVVGVAPGVRLWAVRVNDAYGQTSASAQLCGIDWLTQNGPGLGIKVVNASQGLFGAADDGNCGYTANDVLHQAICASTAAGITWVFAAGNSTRDLEYLSGATYDEVLAVTAVADSNGQPNVGSGSRFSCRTVTKSSQSDTDDTEADFSNWAVSAADQAHTIAAPGVCIYSTYKGTTYGYMGGTSQAAPHATAAVHLCVISGQCTGVPAENIQKVRSDAAAFAQANPTWGFAGDPGHPTAGRYYGDLIRAGLY
jgi:hypothetical protein